MKCYKKYFCALNSTLQGFYAVHFHRYSLFIFIEIYFVVRKSLQNFNKRCFFRQYLTKFSRFSKKQTNVCLEPQMNLTTTLSDPQDISELFGSHFAAISADSNYDSHFLNLKSQAKAHPISFNSEDPFFSYNLVISSLELRSTIHKNHSNASPGPDNIHASMFKHLHTNSFDYLLSLFNAILLQGSYSSGGNWLSFCLS